MYWIDMNADMTIILQSNSIDKSNVHVASLLTVNYHVVAGPLVDGIPEENGRKQVEIHQSTMKILAYLVMCFGLCSSMQCGNV